MLVSDLISILQSLPAGNDVQIRFHKPYADGRAITEIRKPLGAEDIEPEHGVVCIYVDID
jgi:hypothetical protein